MFKTTFVDKCLTGRALINDISDYVDLWHKSANTKSLHEFLGLTWEEYKLWVEDNSSLAKILSARREGISVQEVLSRGNNQLLAARTQDKREVSKISTWLAKRAKKK